MYLKINLTRREAACLWIKFPAVQNFRKIPSPAKFSRIIPQRFSKISSWLKFQRIFLKLKKFFSQFLQNWDRFSNRGGKFLALRSYWKNNFTHSGNLKQITRKISKRIFTFADFSLAFKIFFKKFLAVRNKGFVFSRN